MAGPRKTRIERLGGKVREYVDLRLEDNRRRQCVIADICKELKIKFGVDVPPTTLRNYKYRRWDPMFFDLLMSSLFTDYIVKRLGPDAISNEVQSRILQSLHEIFTHGVKLNPEFLLREERLWADHNLRKRALENTERRMERADRERFGTGARGGKGKAASHEKADPAEIRRRIREIYGLPDEGSADTSPGPTDLGGRASLGPEANSSAPAVPGQVGPR
jgi:hypothetical protein